MKYDYFYGKAELESFSYYSLPRVFFEKEKYMDMSIEAKILYSILLDKMNLSYNVLGDSNHPGKIKNAISDAYQICKDL